MSNAYDIVMSNRQEIVDHLIEQMEKGYVATRQAWSKSATGRPYNPTTDAFYKGGNRFRLMLAAAEAGFTDSRWMTFNQAAEKNYKIAYGAKGVLLEKWIFYKDVPQLDEAQHPVIGEDGRPIMLRTIYKNPIVNYFRVFNGEQVIGLPELVPKEVTQDACFYVAHNFEKSSMCPVSYEQQDRAYYSPMQDEIHLPPKNSFKNNQTRLSVLLHEMAHSTGHESRLNRALVNEFASMSYAKEELNAELSSVFLESDLGIAMEMDSELLKDHANYVKSWIEVLKQDPNELFVACATAEHITEYLMKNYEHQLQQNREAQHQVDKMMKMSLEERYTKAMNLAGYYGISDDSTGAAGFLVFQEAKTGESVAVEGWQSVGSLLEKLKPVEVASSEQFEELVHPQGRLQYYTRNMNGTALTENVKPLYYESFDRAYQAYIEGGTLQGKTLGFSINRETSQDLIWYDTAELENILYRASLPAACYAPQATRNELNALELDMGKAVEWLQKENAFVQVAREVANLQFTTMNYVNSKDLENGLLCRLANTRRPQDYVELQMIENQSTQNLELNIRIVCANAIINTESFTANLECFAKNDISAFDNKNIAEWLKSEIMHMDTDFNMPMGQKVFTTYAQDSWEGLEKHFELLEQQGYDKNPSCAYVNHVVENEIVRDIETAGFRPTKTLIYNLQRLQQISGKGYTLKELAQIKKSNQDFSQHAEKQTCFNKIVEECREQENSQKQDMTNKNDVYLKQEIKMEKMAIAQL